MDPQLRINWQKIFRQKGKSLLRSHGSCPKCGARGTLEVSTPTNAGMLDAIDCRPPNGCGKTWSFASTYLARLGGIADQIRRRLDLKKKAEGKLNLDMANLFGRRR